MTLSNLSKLIKDQNKKLNLLSSGDIKKLQSKHFADSKAVLKIWKAEQGAFVLDIGTGGGLPGLVLAVQKPKMKFKLLDATKKKISAVREIIKKMKLKNCEAGVGRCEILGHDKKYREKFDAVTARALAPLPALLELAAGFVKEGGRFYAWKGQHYKDELKNAKNAIKILNFKLTDQYEYEVAESGPRVILEFTKIAKLDPQYPRKNGVPLKSPL